MTDQTIPADQARRARQWARDILDDVENGASVNTYARDAARTLMAMMPRPTLADMTPQQRDECQWMQADTNGGRDVISRPNYDQGRATLLLRDGSSIPVSLDRITPRPDLPRMEWPRDTGIPGVAVGVPVTDPDLIQRISDEAPTGTIVVEANLNATVRNGRYWNSGEEAHLTLTEALFYSSHQWGDTDPITVVRWGE